MIVIMQHPDAVREQGRDARRAGEPIDVCPYDDLALVDGWRGGWWEVDDIIQYREGEQGNEFVETTK